MPTLLWSSPGWLWGLAAVAVPLAIHFLSRGTARRVAVGSVALLLAGSSRRARRIRFTDPLLAALRVLLLALVALALAAPRWLPGPPAGVWGLVDPGLAAWLHADPSVAPAVAERLESLAADGSLRLLAAGLPPVRETPADEIPARGLLVDEKEGVAGGTWSLLREASASAPPGTLFEVFTFGTVDELVGRRPAVAGVVSWQTVVPPPATWTARVTRSQAGVRQWRAHSGPAVTTVASVVAAAADWPAVTRADPLRITVYAEPERMGDADHVVAALEAIEQAGWLLLSVSRTTVVATEANTEANAGVDARAETGPETGPETGREPGVTNGALNVLAPPVADIAIWLVARPFEAAWRPWLASGGVLLQDAETTRYRDCLGSADLPDGLGTVSVRRCAAANEAMSTGISGQRSVPVWRDRQGRTLLSASTAGNIWTFAGRFHPAWSDLVLSPAFPHWLAQWLDHQARRRGQVAEERQRDRRQATAADRQVARLPEDGTPEDGTPEDGIPEDGQAFRLTSMAETRALVPWLWILVALTGVVERLWVARRPA